MRGLVAVLCVLALALLAGGCGGGGETESEEPAREQIREGEPDAGGKVFLEAGCGTCHTFKAAGTTKTVGPNLDLVVKTYDEAFIKESIIDPEAYTEKIGEEPGSIGGDRPYHATMPPYGAKADTPDQQLTNRELADLVAFLVEGR